MGLEEYSFWKLCVLKTLQKLRVSVTRDGQEVAVLTVWKDTNPCIMFMQLNTNCMIYASETKSALCF